MRLIIILVLFPFCLSAQIATSGLPAVKSNVIEDTIKNNSQILYLESFEYNTVSYTNDSDDEGFMDFTISQRYPLRFIEYLYPFISGQQYNITTSGDTINHRINPYYFSLHFAFTGRFAQYIGSRDSGPVIGKRFNPFLFIEYSHPDRPNSKYRFGYGHESNGQSINDSTTFLSAAYNNEENINETIDYISRGWDYWSASATICFLPESENIVLFTDLSLRYYLKKGILQGGNEEYRTWERDWSGRNLQRNDVSGISIAAECVIDKALVNKIRVSAETGIKNTLRYNSIRAQISINQALFPLYLSYANGYNGDLAQFGKRNSSFSVGLLFSTFNFPLLIRSEREAKLKRELYRNK